MVQPFGLFLFKMFRHILISFVISANVAHVALAQPLQKCALPSSEVLSNAPQVSVGKVNNKPFDFYLLSLSWSPEWCSRPQSKNDKTQCVDNRFGFVVHGLWPNRYDAKVVDDHPAFCQNAPITDMSIFRPYMCWMPSTFLIAHEWLKHGSCAFDRPYDYYRKIEDLWNRIKKPQISNLHEAIVSTTAGEVRAKFAQLNADIGLKSAFIGLQVNHSNADQSATATLKEVHICYDKFFHVIQCPDIGLPDDTVINVRRAR